VLIFAFYARKNTLTPNLIQGAAILCYLLTALPLLWFTQLGFLALVIGNSAQWIGHAMITFALLSRAAPLRGQRLGEAAVKAALASALMAACVAGLAAALGDAPAPLVVALAGGAGMLLYLAISAALRVEALGFFIAALRARL